MSHLAIPTLMEIEQLFSEISDTIQQFEPISLEEMSAVKLMNRIDSKYVIPLRDLQPLLAEARSQYLVQAKQDGVREAGYHTIYLDTPTHRMYEIHATGRQVRQKIRVRTYTDTDETFLEIKNKNNHGRTKKKRILVAHNIGEGDCCEVQDLRSLEEKPEKQTEPFVANRSWFTLDQLQPHVENQFRRITLVNRARTERLTIDLDIHFRNYENQREEDISHLAIIELKRDGLTFSPMKQLLQQHHIHPGGFSKYCIGCALTNPTLRSNNFKEKLRRIERMKTSR